MSLLLINTLVCGDLNEGSFYFVNRALQMSENMAIIEFRNTLHECKNNLVNWFHKKRSSRF